MEYFFSALVSIIKKIINHTRNTCKIYKSYMLSMPGQLKKLNRVWAILPGKG